MSDPPRPDSLPPGYDEENPYDGEDISEYPRWWQKNIEEFRSHDFRPYRPPRFADGEFTPTVINPLRADLGVDIQFRTINPDGGSDWEVLVDGERIGTVERSRSGEGYVTYHITSDEFEDLVRSAAGH